MVYALKLKSGEAKIYSIETLAREIESIGSLSVEDVSHVMKSFVRAMKKVLVAGDKVKVDGLGIFYTTLTCPGVEQEKDCTVKNISRVNLRFKVDNSLRLANDSTATTRGGENNVSFELYTEKKAASEGEEGRFRRRRRWLRFRGARQGRGRFRWRGDSGSVYLVDN